ncbi:uncharacterized protein LOC133533793 [Cydia pomonella]|uniref:uncharacterized protein LOC133518399 n=1 Tax=Cydia pomonella TaxID=82600 RepID=UPI002ADDC8F9|nr:uncharacterized protein LOC133518399 [Cydia pomonella]XP_061728828.1 uncharacterized protein LOC133533793 [Cydia pomonella]
MSSLFRSLLALAALLALVALMALLANASHEEICTTELFGRKTIVDVYGRPIRFWTGGGRIDIPDGCQKQGKRLAGVLVKVCNYNQNGQNGVPNVVELDDFSPLNVTCTDGCPGGGSLTYTQYCHYT